MMLTGRFAELANEATQYCKTQPREIAGSLWEAKFAELIVRECIDVVIKSDDNPKMIVHEPYRTIMNNIQDRFFGVE